MRKITRDALDAFNAVHDFKRGNTEVLVSPDWILLLLHSNCIIKRNRANGETYINAQGWFTNTTKERLNGLLGGGISQQAGTWYLYGQPFQDGWQLVHRYW